LLFQQRKHEDIKEFLKKHLEIIEDGRIRINPNGIKKLSNRFIKGKLKVKLVNRKYLKGANWDHQ
jgi:hypothetical protein